MTLLAARNVHYHCQPPRLIGALLNLQASQTMEMTGLSWTARLADVSVQLFVYAQWKTRKAPLSLRHCVHVQFIILEISILYCKAHVTVIL